MMDYLHHKSMPATLSSLEVFTVPSTQLAVESVYDVDFRPTSTMDGAATYDVNIPATEDFTDLSETMLQIRLSIVDKDSKNPQQTDTINIVNGFGNFLFNQIDVYVGGINTSQANGSYHYLAYLEDTLFKHLSKADFGSLYEDTERRQKIIQKKEFDVYCPMHSPLTSQNTLLLNNTPIQLKFTRNSPTFGLVGDNTKGFKIQIKDLAVRVRRVKLFPDVSLGIQEGLEKSPANYFVTRNVVKNFTIPQSYTIANFEDVFAGVLPRRIIVGFLSNNSFNGLESPTNFTHFNISSLVSQVNGVKVPSKPYEPNFANDLYMREFVDLYRYTNQYNGLSMLKINYDQYKESMTLFAFDYTTDGHLGSESGTLSLLKRGTLKIEVKFASALTKPIHMIVFSQFDNLIQIDRYRNVSVDW